MDYEKKYKEALERAKKLRDNANGLVLQKWCENVFPELKESEERIRKEIIAFLKENLETGRAEETWSISGLERWIAWIEKQGKKQQKTPIWKHWKNGIAGNGEGKPIYLIKHGYTYRLTACLSFECDYIELSELDKLLSEEQGEQKPDDAVEPKFHEGEWIVHQGTENIYQVVAIIANHYQLKYGDNYTVQKCADVDRYARLWDITKDAKDGDVLSDGTTIFIFKDLLSDGSVMSYCDYDTDSGESDAFCPLSVNLICSKITPATKEQREQLKKAMADAGYTFDFEKKELKKI